MRVEVVSPEDELFSGDADFVLARTVEGDIGILPQHAPLLAQLAPCEIKVRTSGGDRTLEVTGGFMTVKDDKVIILAETLGAEAPNQGEERSGA